MQIQVQQKSLVQALRRLKLGVPQGGALPILECVAIQAKGSTLTLWVANGDWVIQNTLPAHVVEEGETCIKYQELMQATKMLQGTLALKTTEEQASLCTDKEGYEFPTLPFEDFPFLPEVQWQPLCKFKTEWIDPLLSAAATDDSRPILQSITLHNADDGFFIIATDTHRLAYQRFAPLPTPFEAIIPISVAKQLSKLLPAGTLAIGTAEEELFLSLKEKEISCIIRCWQGDLPDWRVILRSNQARVAVVYQREELRRALKKMQVTYEEKVRFHYEFGKVILQSEGVHIRAWAEVPAIVTGVVPDNAFNVRYFLDALERDKAEKVTVYYPADPKAPIFICNPNGVKEFLMPMEIQ